MPNVTTAATLVNQIQEAFQEQVSSEYKRRSGNGSAKDQRDNVNLRYEQLNKAVNDSLTIPGLTREVPEGNCDTTTTIEQTFKLIVQDDDAFCQDMVGLIPRYFDALTADYQLKARSHQYTRPERANTEAGHRDEGQQDADTGRRTREMAEMTAALRLSTAPREQQRADEHSSLKPSR
jgi:hypothetical protein